VAALAGDLEGNIVWGVALDLDGAGGQVVEILVQQLESRRACQPNLRAIDAEYTIEGNSEQPPTLALSRERAAPEAAGTYVVGGLGDVGEGRDRHDGQL
jgi:hypothetical protein